jgi:transposase
MRGRKPAPINGLDQYNFSKMAKTKGSPRERVRFLAMAHIQDGKSFSDAARMIKVAPRTVIEWVTKFRRYGIEGLQEKSGRGAKPLLPKDQYEKFRTEVEKLQQERQGGRIRAKDVADLLYEKWGIRAAKTCVYETLHRAGLVWITGRSKHPKGDIEAQDNFKKNSKTK